MMISALMSAPALGKNGHTDLMGRWPRLFFALALVIIFVPACSKEQPHQRHAARKTALATPEVFPLAPTGWVTDAADIIDPARRARLAAKLAQLEQATGHQLVVVTVPTLGGRDVALFTRDLGRRWGIGRKGHDDGVVLLVAPNERKVRIAVGYGLEKILPDKACAQIIDTLMLPRFRGGDLADGIEAGADALVAGLR